MTRLELLEKIEQLEKQTGFLKAVYEPKKYKDNTKKILKLRKQLLKMSCVKAK